MTPTLTGPLKIDIPAVDGFPLHAHAWVHEVEDGGNLPPVVIINPATSVQSRYYSRFADFLYAHGFNVITYDYRGIGGSRPESMRGFRASWLDWGSKDFEGVLRFAGACFKGHDILVAAHSVGGFLVGMAPSSQLIKRVFTMGSQFAYWRGVATRWQSHQGDSRSAHCAGAESVARASVRIQSISVCA